MRVRRRAIGLLLGAGVLYLIGTNAQAGWLFVLAVLLLGTAAAGAILPLTTLRRLDVELSAPAETRQGEPTGSRCGSRTEAARPDGGSSRTTSISAARRRGSDRSDPARSSP